MSNKAVADKIRLIANANNGQVRLFLTAPVVWNQGVGAPEAAKTNDISGTLSSCDEDFVTIDKESPQSDHLFIALEHVVAIRGHFV